MIRKHVHKAFHNGSNTYIGSVQFGMSWNAVQPHTTTDLTGNTVTGTITRSDNDIVVYPNAGAYDEDFTFLALATVGTSGWNETDLTA